MRTPRHLLALAAAGILWGTTVPLTKVALDGFGPGWLTVARFALAALPLALVARRTLRAAINRGTLGWGAFGFGAVIVLQNAGIGRTSVSHAALLVGATPVLVALFTVALGRGRVGVVPWLGFAAAIGGIFFVASHGGSGATLAGDGLVFASVLLSAAFLMAQPRLLAGRDPVAVTAVQLAAAAVFAVPAAVIIDGVPAATPSPGATLAMAGLAVGGTLLPFTLFAYGQANVTPEVAGAFLNLEPLVGVAVGAVAFGEGLGTAQLLGALAILGGIALSTAPAFGRSAGAAGETVGAVAGRSAGAVGHAAGETAGRSAGAVSEAVGQAAVETAEVLPQRPPVVREFEPAARSGQATRTGAPLEQRRAA